MSEVFRELTPQEIQQAVLQFMGQNLGELKDLDSNLINKNNTLQGMTLRPGEIMRSIPAPTGPSHSHTPQVVNAPSQPISIPNAPPPVQSVTLPQPEINPNDPVQMEFNFEKSSYAKNIFESLRQIETTLNYQTEIIQELEKKVNLLTQAPKKKKED